MTTLKVNPQFLVDETGERSSVLLSLRDYRRILRHVENLEDALALDHAIKTSSKMLDYGEVRKRLKAAGKL